MEYSMTFYIQDPDEYGLGLVRMNVHKQLHGQYLGMANAVEAMLATPDGMDEHNPIPWMLACLATGTRLLEQQLAAEQAVGSEKLMLSFREVKTL